MNSCNVQCRGMKSQQECEPVRCVVIGQRVRMQNTFHPIASQDQTQCSVMHTSFLQSSVSYRQIYFHGYSLRPLMYFGEMNSIASARSFTGDITKHYWPTARQKKHMPRGTAAYSGDSTACILEQAVKHLFSLN